VLFFECDTLRRVGANPSKHKFGQKIGVAWPLHRRLSPPNISGNVWLDATIPLTVQTIQTTYSPIIVTIGEIKIGDSAITVFQNLINGAVYLVVEGGELIVGLGDDRVFSIVDDTLFQTINDGSNEEIATIKRSGGGSNNRRSSRRSSRTTSTTSTTSSSSSSSSDSSDSDRDSDSDSDTDDTEENMALYKEMERQFDEQKEQEEQSQKQDNHAIQFNFDEFKQVEMAPRFAIFDTDNVYKPATLWVSNTDPLRHVLHITGTDIYEGLTGPQYSWNGTTLTDGDGDEITHRYEAQLVEEQEEVAEEAAEEEPVEAAEAAEAEQEDQDQDESTAIEPLGMEDRQHEPRNEVQLNLVDEQMMLSLLIPSLLIPVPENLMKLDSFTITDIQVDEGMNDDDIQGSSMAGSGMEGGGCEHSSGGRVHYGGNGSDHTAGRRGRLGRLINDGNGEDARQQEQQEQQGQQEQQDQTTDGDRVCVTDGGRDDRAAERENKKTIRNLHYSERNYGRKKAAIEFVSIPGTCNKVH